MGALVEITDVAMPEPPELEGGFLDEPKSGAVLDAHVVDVLGWAIGAEKRAAAVEFAIDGKSFWRAPLRAERPDLTEAFPDRSEAGRSGFRTTLNMIGKPAEFELEVLVVLKDQHRVRLGDRRRPPPLAARQISRLRGPGLGRDPLLRRVAVPQRGDRERAHPDYPHLEIVVVEDESMDNASSIASRYPGVRCVRRRTRGMAGARNVGIRSTNGDFLVFLDADDTLLPDAIEAGLRELGTAS